MNYSQSKIKILGLLVGFTFATPSFSQNQASSTAILVGGAAAAGRPSARASDINPATAVFLPTSEIEGGFNMFENNDFKIRYRGSNPIKKATTGAVQILSIGGAGVFKFNESFSLGVTKFIPPVSANLEVKDVPIVILDQPNFVNAKVKAQVGGVSVVGAYAISPTFGVGLKIMYNKLGITADATPSEGGEQLLTIDTQTQTTSLVLGVRMETPKFNIGVSSTIFHSETVSSAITSPLMDSAGVAAPDSAKANTTPVKDVVIGVGFKPSPKFMIVSDITYRRPPAESQQFSIVELKEKTRDDQYHSASVGIGIDFNVNKSISLLGGFHYEPATVGPGSRAGEGGDTEAKSGFGTLDTIPIYAAGGDLLPYMAYSAGMRFEFGKRIPIREADSGDKDKSKGKKDKDREKPGVYSWAIETGLRYQTASLGIDESGELPAAYSQTKITIPINIAWRF